MATEDETTLVTAVCLPMTALLHRYKQIKYEHLVAGIAGGVVSTSILHPLDTIRTRLAGAAPQHKQLYTHNFKGCNNNCEIDIFQKIVSGSQLICANVRRPHYGGLVDVLTSMTRTDGLHGLYRGVSLGILTAGCTWGSYFFL
jgi:solute carrier family 25 folate transporter 32